MLNKNYNNMLKIIQIPNSKIERAKESYIMIDVGNMDIVLS